MAVGKNAMCYGDCRRYSDQLLRPTAVGPIAPATIVAYGVRVSSFS
jgi:hypothetical protein